MRDDGSVAELLLAWMPGGDESQERELYRAAFDVLQMTVNPALTPEERSATAETLGLDDSHRVSRPATKPPPRCSALATRYVRHCGRRHGGDQRRRRPPAWRGLALDDIQRRLDAMPDLLEHRRERTSK